MSFVYIGRKQFGSSPSLYANAWYEQYRSGANMYYRIQLSVEPCSGASYYGYPLTGYLYIDSNLEDSNTLKDSFPSQWTEDLTWISGWHSISKTTGTTWLAVQIWGAAGTASERWISIDAHPAVEPAGSVLGTIADFNLEDGFSVPVTKYSSSFSDELSLSIGAINIKTIPNYTNGSSIKLTDAELLGAYTALGSGKSTEVSFALSTKSGSTTVGTDNGTATATAAGTAHIKVSGAWKRAVAWIKVSGVWKRAVCHVKAESWRRGA